MPPSPFTLRITETMTVSQLIAECRARDPAVTGITGKNKHWLLDRLGVGSAWILRAATNASRNADESVGSCGRHKPKASGVDGRAAEVSKGKSAVKAEHKKRSHAAMSPTSKPKATRPLNDDSNDRKHHKTKKANTNSGGAMATNAVGVKLSSLPRIEASRTVAQLSAELLRRDPSATGLSGKPKRWFLERLGIGSVWTSAAEATPCDLSGARTVSSGMTVAQLTAEVLERGPNKKGLSGKTKEWFLGFLGIGSIWITAPDRTVAPSNMEKITDNKSNATTTAKAVTCSRSPAVASKVATKTESSSSKIVMKPSNAAKRTDAKSKETEKKAAPKGNNGLAKAKSEKSTASSGAGVIPYAATSSSATNSLTLDPPLWRKMERAAPKGNNGLAKAKSEKSTSSGAGVIPYAATSSSATNSLTLDPPFWRKVEREQTHREYHKDPSGEGDDVDVHSFNIRIRKPGPENLNEKNLLKYTIWTSIARSGDNGPKLFDSSFDSLDDANKRAEFVFYFKSDVGHGPDEIAPKIDCRDKHGMRVMISGDNGGYSDEWTAAVCPNNAFGYLNGEATSTNRIDYSADIPTKSKFPKNVRKPTGRHLNEGKMLTFAVWKACGDEVNHWDDSCGEVPPQMEFDSSFESLREANSRVEYLFWHENPWGHDDSGDDEYFTLEHDEIKGDGFRYLYARPDDREGWIVASMPSDALEYLISLQEVKDSEEPVFLAW